MATQLFSMNDLFLDELRDLHDAETQIAKALPKLAGAAQALELKSGFQQYLKQTQTHVTRLNRIFYSLGQNAAGEKCDFMRGVLSEGEKSIHDAGEGAMRDAALIATAQHIERYQIAAYGSARTFAQILGRKDAAELLEETLREEKETGRKLTDIAHTIAA